MIFSKACEYGIKATVYIAQKSLNNERCNVKDISTEIDSPEAFTAKILQKLSRANIINSTKGAMGGFEIETKKIKQTKLIDIVIAIDGELNEKTCALGLKKCSDDNPCPVHDNFKHIKKNLLAMLHHTSLSEMSKKVDAGLSYLKI